MTRRERIAKERELMQWKIREAKRIAGLREGRGDRFEIEQWKRQVVLRNEQAGISLGC